MSNKEERIEISIQEDMDVSQYSWLETKLEHEKGIVSAWFEGGDHHHLIVHYDINHFSHITLLDAIKRLGFHGEIVGS